MCRNPFNLARGKDSRQTMELSETLPSIVRNKLWFDSSEQIAAIPLYAKLNAKH